MELNRIVQQDKSQKDRITPMVVRCFADLGLAYELRARLRVLCPEFFELETEETRDDTKTLNLLTKEHGILALYDVKMITGPSHAGEKFLRLGDLGDPTRLPYRVSKKRTKNNVEMMQATERQLDAVWDRWDAHLKKHLSQKRTPYFKALCRREASCSVL